MASGMDSELQESSLGRKTNVSMVQNEGRFGGGTPCVVSPNSPERPLDQTTEEPNLDANKKQCTAKSSTEGQSGSRKALSDVSGSGVYSKKNGNAESYVEFWWQSAIDFENSLKRPEENRRLEELGKHNFVCPVCIKLDSAKPSREVREERRRRFLQALLEYERKKWTDKGLLPKRP